MQTLMARNEAEAIAHHSPLRDQVGDQLDSAAVVFLTARRRLLAIAYRIVKCPFEAEDIVQDAWIRWQTVDHAAVLNAEAFLVTATTRLALNDVQSARHRHETPTGPWLSESAATEPGPEPGAERAEQVGQAILALLARLTAAERAAFMLREAFAYPYEQIADLLELKPANCRQLVRRARSRLSCQPRRPVNVTVHRRLLEGFCAAAVNGSLADLEALLVADVHQEIDHAATAHRDTG